MVWYQHSESSSLSASASGGVSGDGGDVLDAADLDAISGDGSKGRLSAWSGGFVAVTSSGSELDVDSGDVELLESVDNVNGGLHSSIGGTLVAVSFDFHSTGDSGESLTAGEIGDVDKGIIPGGEDVTDCEDVS